VAGDPIYTIGDFEFNTVSGCLRRLDDPKGNILGNNEARLLTFLIQHFDKASRRDEYKKKLIAEVWQGIEVSDHSLYKSVWFLRYAFGDDGKEYVRSNPFRLGTTPVLNSVPMQPPSAQVQAPLANKSKATHIRRYDRSRSETRENGSELNLDRGRRKIPIRSGKLDEREPMARTIAGSFDRNALFSYPGGYAEAIRLFGRGKQYLSPKQLFVDYTHSLYTIPRELRDNAKKRIARLEDEASRFNKLLFNGPTVRLMRWHHNQEGPAEIDMLRIVLGAAGWYDLEGTNGLIREDCTQRDAYSSYVDMAKIQSGDFEHGCQLSNVVGNAVTIFTADGKVGFQMRGNRQSAVPGMLTSAVAENVNRYKDDTDRERPNVLLNNPGESLPTAKDAAYAPRGVPHPFAAVLRGLSYEVSSRILESVGSHAIKVTGLAFGLDSLAPDLLWIVLANVTEEEFVVMRRDRPGIEADEGIIEFVPPSFDNPRTQELLMRTDWIPAGKASLVRAIHLIEEVAPSGDPVEAFRVLANAT